MTDVLKPVQTTAVFLALKNTFLKIMIFDSYCTIIPCHAKINPYLRYYYLYQTQRNSNEEENEGTYLFRPVNVSSSKHQILTFLETVGYLVRVYTIRYFANN